LSAGDSRGSRELRQLRSCRRKTLLDRQSPPFHANELIISLKDQAKASESKIEACHGMPSKYASAGNFRGVFKADTQQS